MGEVKIRPWRFGKGEVVELYWLCSPFLHQEKGWMIKVLFKRQNNLLEEDTLPWGLLPILTVGQKFKDGYTINEKAGEISEIKVSPDVKKGFVAAYNLPKYLYSVYNSKEAAIQKLCKLEIDNKIYYLPCIEVVRSYLAPYRSLVNNIVKPSGLMNLVSYHKFEKDSFYLEFTNEISRSAINEQMVKVFTWLLVDKDANTAWNSVYKNMLKYAIKVSPTQPNIGFSSGIPVLIYPPLNTPSTWVYRGITFQNETLILELIGKTKLLMPFNMIYYNHHSFRKINYTNMPSGKVHIKEKQKNPKMNIDKEGFPARKGEDIIDDEYGSIQFGFNRNPYMIRKPKEYQNVGSDKSNGTKLVIKHSKNIGSETVNVSAQDWTKEGKLLSIEFKTLEIVEKEKHNGLEEFLQAITYLNLIDEDLIILANVVFVPMGKQFSVYESGERRNYAVVKISCKGRTPCFILEVGRSDDWSISTLFITPTTTEALKNIEEYIDSLLHGLVENNGHWNMSVMKRNINYSIDTAKHVMGQSVERWGERIKNKIR